MKNSEVKIFITGGLGYIGTALAKEALKRGFDVYLYDSLVYKQNSKKVLREINGKNKNAELKFIKGDTRNIPLLRKSLEKWKPDFLFHFAELVGVYACDYNPKHTRAINFSASKNVLNLATKLNIPTIYNSTSSVYGNQKKAKLLKENDEIPAPTDNYCKNKLLMENHIEKLRKKYPNFKVIVLRPATVWGIGPRMRIELLPNHFTYSAIAKGRIRISEPQAYRAEMDIDDIVESYFAIMGKKSWKKPVYNVGSDNLKKIEVAEKIKSFIPCEIETIGNIGDMRNLQIDSTNFRNDFDWKPKNTFEGTIQKVAAWIKKNKKEMESTKFKGILNSPLHIWQKMI